jgi:hypothetical protein
MRAKAKIKPIKNHSPHQGTATYNPIPETEQYLQENHRIIWQAF